MTTTYDSNTDLSLGSVPDVSDPQVYLALLDIHNALSNIVTGVGGTIDDFIAKYRNINSILPAASPYTMQATDGLVLINAATAAVEVITPSAITYPGYQFTIICVDATYEAKLSRTGAELISGETEWTFHAYDGVQIKSDGNNWLIVG